MRWERHWWQKTETVAVVQATEPTVWVDPELYVEVERPRRSAQGTVPPPCCIGPFCSLEVTVEAEAETLVEADAEPTLVTAELLAVA